MTDPELPNHLRYALTFGGLLVGAVAALIIEFGVRGGRRRLGIIAWSLLAGLVGAVFLVINVANIVGETITPGAG